LVADIAIERSGWVALRARGPESRHVFDGPAWAHSSPVFVTVAGPGGAAIEPTSKTHGSLTGALRKYGDELVTLTLKTYRQALFRLSANVKVAADRVVEDVLNSVRLALLAAFAFDAREFRQPVSIDEVVAVMHRVDGVEAVDVDVLRRSDQSTPVVRPRLFASQPVVAGSDVLAAELLMLDAATLQIGVLS